MTLKEPFVMEFGNKSKSIPRPIEVACSVRISDVAFLKAGGRQDPEGHGRTI